MIDTSQKMTEIDFNEALIKLDNKLLNAIMRAVLLKRRLFQAEIRINRGKTRHLRIIY